MQTFSSRKQIRGCLEMVERDYQGGWGNAWGRWVCSPLWRQRWFQTALCVSKRIKLYALNTCSLLSTNYTSRKLWDPHRHPHTERRPQTLSRSYPWYPLYGHLSRHLHHRGHIIHYSTTYFFHLDMFSCGHTNLPHFLKWLTGNLVGDCFVIFNISSIWGHLRDFQFLLDNFFFFNHYSSLQSYGDLTQKLPAHAHSRLVVVSPLSPHTAASNQAVLAYFLHLVGSVGNFQALLVLPCEWGFLTRICPSQIHLVPGCQGDLSKHKSDPFGMPTVAQRIKNPIRIHEDTGSIAGLSQWVKDLALSWAAMYVAEVGQIPCCCGCGWGIGWQLQLNLTPGLGTSICCWCGPKKEKKKEKIWSFHSSVENLSPKTNPEPLIRAYQVLILWSGPALQPQF